MRDDRILYKGHLRLSYGCMKKHNLIPAIILLLVTLALSSCNKTEKVDSSKINATYRSSSEESINPLRTKLERMLQDVGYALKRGLKGVKEERTTGKATKGKIEYNGYLIEGDRIRTVNSQSETVTYEVAITKDHKLSTVISTTTLDRGGHQAFIGQFNNVVYTDPGDAPNEYTTLLAVAKNAFSDPKADTNDFINFENRVYSFDNVDSLYSTINGNGRKTYSVKEEIYTVELNLNLIEETGNNLNIYLEYTESLDGKVEPISLTVDGVLYNPYTLKSTIESNLI